MAVDGYTVVVDAINDFFPRSLVTSSVFGPQYEVVNYGSQHTDPDVCENDSMAQSIPWFILSAVL